METSAVVVDPSTQIMSHGPELGGDGLIPDRPNQPLVVRLAFSNLPRRINFKSAATCRLDILKQRVEECYHLSASTFYLSYVDEDGEETAIKTEDDWTDTINWFLSGDEEASLDNVRPSFQPTSSTKIVVRLDIVVEYDGPSLSDTSSLAGSSEYSSSDGQTEYSQSEKSWAHASHRSSNEHGLSSRSSHASEIRGPGPRSGGDVTAGRSSNGHSTNLEQEAEQEATWTQLPAPAGDLSSRWLEEQTRLAMRKMGSPSSSGSPSTSRPESDDGSSFIDSDDEHSVGSLSLLQDPSGRYYYSYNEGSNEAGPSHPPTAPTSAFQPRTVATACSACKTTLEFMCYACTSCARMPRVSYDDDHDTETVSSLGSSESDQTAWAAGRSNRSPGSDGSNTIYNEPRNRSASLSTHASQSSSGAAPLGLTRFTPVIQMETCDLCPNCFPTAGLDHSRRNIDPDTQIRHAFEELLKEDAGWITVGQEPRSLCALCDAQLESEYFHCSSCANFALCRNCYSHVEEVHPVHVFLHIDFGIEFAFQSQSLNGTAAQVASSTTLRSHQHYQEHAGAFCHHCLETIVGVRYHCAVCPSWDLCERCETSAEANTALHTADHIMMKIPQPLPPADVETITRRARDRWYRQDWPAVTQASNSSASTSRAATVIQGRSRDWSASHDIKCSHCLKWIDGVRYQCANCPSDPIGYNLCSTCEPRSHRVHDPLHAFFQLDRPVEFPLTSETALLPILYKSKVGRVPASAANHPRTTTTYLSYLVHQDTVCDIHGDQIRGIWLRCCHCPDGFDMCADAKEFAAHDPKHVFLVLKAPVDMVVFRSLVALESEVRQPLLARHVYR